MTTAVYGGVYGPGKEAQKHLNDDYNPALDITCAEFLTLQKEQDTKLKEFRDFANKNPDQKKEIRKLEKEWIKVVERDQKIHTNYTAKQILYSRITGNLGISYNGSNTDGAYWEIRNSCNKHKEFADYPLSQVMILMTSSKASARISMQKQLMQNLEDQLKACEEKTDPAVDKSARRFMKDLIEKSSVPSNGNSGSSE
jgi:hypothetical protein